MFAKLGHGRGREVEEEMLCSALEVTRLAEPSLLGTARLGGRGRSWQCHHGPAGLDYQISEP